ncbi:MAG: Rne/Rng family ribonuclease [Solirubrobacterales bacterium]
MKKEILVSVDRGETRVAVLEAKGAPSRGKGGGKKIAPGGDFKVGELYVERRGRRSIVGNIYKGRVDNVLPGMEAAFVDFGLERNGFLHVDEIVLPDGKAVPKRGRGRGRRIDELIQPGQEIVVQVVKDPLKTKGARLSMQLSIAGRYLVFMPQGGGVGVSKRLPDGERQRLRKLIEKVDIGKGGVIVRTAAQGGKKEDFGREISYLHRLDEIVAQRAKESEVGQMIFQEADLSIRVVRDVLVEEFEGAIIDDPKQHERVTKFLQRTAPELAESVELYQEKQPLLEKWDVVKAFESTLSRRVDLPSGGYLMIDYAEALTVIDVNSGSFTGKGKNARLEDTILKTNLEAAEAVVNELRLRDIGGIIVIDFIDMARARNRDAVLKTLRKTLDEDRTKTFTAEISKLGLVEMTRQNVTEGVREIMTRACPVCHGDGVVLSEETIAIEFERRLRELAARAPRKIEAFLIRMHPHVSSQFTGNQSRVLHALEAETGRHFHFTGSEGLPHDHFDIVLEGSDEDVREQAIPFRAGDEVLVTIVEPHMYAVDDAVAKVDGYIISVTNGGPHVGEKRLVRIEEAGRSSATAVLVDDQPPSGNGAPPRSATKPAVKAAAKPAAKAAAKEDDEKPAPRKRVRTTRPKSAPEAEAKADEEPASADDKAASDGDDVESAPRRRGRRGGRRRSAAKAEATSD